VPIIGDEVVIYPNVIIIGKVVIGDGATVRAGEIALDDVPNFVTVLRSPARVIGSEENLSGAEV